MLDVPTMREWFERGGADETGERVALAEARLRAPIVPKKFFHTAGNFREHEEESKRVGWSHEIAPVDRLLPERRRDRGARRAGRLPRAPDRGARLRARARRRDSGSRGSGSRRRRRRSTSAATSSSTTSPRATSSGARCARASSRSARRSTRSARSGPWIVTPDEIPDPHDLAMELRVNGESRQVSHSGRMSRDDPGDPQPLLGARLLGRRRALDRDGVRASPASPRTPPRSTSSRAT